MSTDSNCGSVGKQSARPEVKSAEIVTLSGSGEAQNHRRKSSVDALLLKQAVFQPQAMKGFLKGLRYFSQMFDGNEKEPEMQIGVPTDVKHVAHIGWDGPSVNQPTWMNGFQQVQDFSSTPLSSTGETTEQSPSRKTSQGSHQASCRGSNGGSNVILESQGRELPELPKPSRQPSGVPDSPNSSMPSDAPKSSRRQQSSGEASDAPKQPRRRNPKPSPSSPTKDSSVAPKHSRRKKCDRLSEGGSVRPSRSKASSSAYSDSDAKSGEQRESGSTRSSRSKANAAYSDSDTKSTNRRLSDDQLTMTSKSKCSYLSESDTKNDEESPTL